MIQKVLVPIVLSALTLYADCKTEVTHVAVGECYEKEGNLNMAQAAYERALIDDEENAYAQLKLAELYRADGMDNDADEQLANINDAQLTPEQRTSLAALRTPSQKERGEFRARATLDLGYDDNINISPITNTTTGDKGSDIGTRFLRFNLDMSYQYDLSDNNGWFLRGDTTLYHQYNLDVTSDDVVVPSQQFDVLYGRIYAGGGYSGDSFSIYVPLFYDRLNYLNKDLFQQVGIRPDFNIMFADMFIVNVNGMYSKRNYIQDADKTFDEKMRDDNILAFGSGFYWVYGKNLAYVKARVEQYSAADKSAIPANTKIFVDKQLTSVGLGGLYSLENILDLRVDLKYLQGDYEEIFVFEPIKRDDTITEIKVAVERDLTKELRARVQLRSLNSESEYKQAIYTKHEILVGLIYTY